MPSPLTVGPTSGNISFTHNIIIHGHLVPLFNCLAPQNTVMHGLVRSWSAPYTFSGASWWPQINFTCLLPTMPQQQGELFSLLQRLLVHLLSVMHGPMSAPPAMLVGANYWQALFVYFSKVIGPSNCRKMIFMDQ